MAFNPSNRPPTTALAEGETSPTVTHYQQVSERVDTIIAEVLTVLPKLELPHPTTVQFVRTHKGIPLDFMETAIAGVARRPELQATSKLDVPTGRDTLQLNQALRPLADNLYHFAKSLKYTLDTRLALLGAESLQVYYLAKGLARDPAGADMLQLVADLKRDFRRSTGPKKKEEEEQKEASEPGTAVVPATKPPAAVRAKRKKVTVVTSL